MSVSTVAEAAMRRDDLALYRGSAPRPLMPRDIATIENDADARARG